MLPVRRLPVVAALFLATVPAFGARTDATEPPRLTLRDAVDRALRRNLGLAVTRIDIDKADAGIDAARAAFDPTFTLGSGFTRFQSAGADYVRRGNASNAWTNNASFVEKFSTGTSVNIYTGFDPDLSATALRSPDIRTRTGIEIRQALNKGSTQAVNLAPIARAKLNLERTQTNLRVAAVNLIRDTEIAYRNLSAAREALAIRENSLTLAQSLLNEIRTRRRPDIGTATEQDELEASAEVAARRVDIETARGRLESTADALRALLGEAPSNDASVPPPRTDSLPENVPPAPDFARFMAETDAFNPDITLRDIDIRDTNTAVEAAADANSASLDLVVGASTLGRGDSAWDALSGQWRDNGSQVTAGLVLSFPLGLRESEAALRVARRNREQAMYRLADARRIAGYAARAAWRDLVNARERLAVADTGVTIQMRAYKGVRARNTRGLASVNDVLLAATRLDNARFSRLNAALDLAVADSRRARLDGACLARNDLRWDEVDTRAASETSPALDAENARP